MTLHNGNVKQRFGKNVIQDIKNSLSVDIICTTSSQIFRSDKKGMFYITSNTKVFCYWLAVSAVTPYSIDFILTHLIHSCCSKGKY